MSSSKSVLSLFVAALTLSTRVAAGPAPQAAPANTAAAYNSAATAASLAAVSAAAAYGAAQSMTALESAYEATAVATGTGSASQPQITGPDACGPKIPDPRVTDSCDSFVQQVNSPNPYGVQCLSDGTKNQVNLTQCESIIPVLCSNEFQHAGEWVWATLDGCSLGSFLPPESYTGAAQWPPQLNCEELIYGAMAEACFDGSSQYNVAAVNLQSLPNANSLGAAVNVGYPSYLIEYAQPRDVSDAADGSGSANNIDVTGTLAAEASAEAQAYSSESAVLATMTGTAAAQALSDLNVYRTAAVDYGS